MVTLRRVPDLTLWFLAGGREDVAIINTDWVAGAFRRVLDDDEAYMGDRGEGPAERAIWLWAPARSIVLTKREGFDSLQHGDCRVRVSETIDTLVERGKPLALKPSWRGLNRSPDYSVVLVNGWPGFNFVETPVLRSVRRLAPERRPAYLSALAKKHGEQPATDRPPFSWLTESENPTWFLPHHDLAVLDARELPSTLEIETRDAEPGFYELKLELEAHEASGRRFTYHESPPVRVFVYDPDMKIVDERREKQ